MGATAQREPLRQGLPWLVLALALHVAVMSIPLAERVARAPTTPSLEVRLEPFVPVPPPQAPSSSERTRPTPASSTPSAPPSATAPPVTAPSPPVLERRPRVPLDQQPWSLGVAPNAPPARRLGDAPPGGRPEAWTRPLLPTAPNLFDRAVVPRDVEIVDRWQSADGGHRVVVNSPDGETYCGRANAYDPLHPELEPVMTWHRCAGGGTRTGRGEAIDFRATP